MGLRGFEEAPRSRQAAAIALAVVLPLLLIAASVAGMERLRSAEDLRESANAGRVVNGKVLQRGVAEAMEDVLARHQPEVLILGNSLSNTDVTGPLLARRLGLRKPQVQKFSVPNSIGAHWYAILKNRVYANGHRPRLVVLHSDMQSLLAVTPRSESIYLNLSVHLEDEEPVIDAKLGTRNWYLQRVRENRSRVRGRALDAARDAFVGLVSGGTLRSDSKATERALARVFDDDRVDMRLHNNVIPIFQQADRTLMPFDPTLLPLPEDSFLPDIAALVAAHGGVPVFVRPPMAPRLPEKFGDVVLPGPEAAVPRFAAEGGGIYLDMRPLDVNDGHFENEDHMNPEGARKFTEALADAILDVGAWEMPFGEQELDLLKPTRIVDGTLVNVEPEVRIEGTVPAVPRNKTRKMTRGPGKMAQFRTDPLGFLSDLATIEVTRHASRCSPIRVVEDGTPLPRPNASCNETYKFLRGRHCHTWERVLFTTPDGSNPFENGRTYELELDPERHCDGARWLYPGDRLALEIDAELLASAPGPLRAVVLQVHDMTPVRGGRRRGASVQVEVHAGDDLLLQGELTARKAPGRGVEIALDRPLQPWRRRAWIELENTSEHFLLLTGARLRRTQD